MGAQTQDTVPPRTPGDRQVHGDGQRCQRLAMLALAGKDAAALDGQVAPVPKSDQLSERCFRKIQGTDDKGCGGRPDEQRGPERSFGLQMECSSGAAE